jgi:hypothetical protein
MSIFNNWPFVSKAEQQRNAEDFDAMVFPFGVEAQREKMKDTLSTLIKNPKVQTNLLLFACMRAKETYIKEGQGSRALEEAKKVIGKIMLKLITEDEKMLILALARLDSEIDSLAEYPTPDDVHKAITGMGV